MENLDVQYKQRAQEIENDIIKLCNLRQMATSVSKEEFQEQYSVDIKQREHIEHKYNLDVRTKIYEFLMNHPKWKNRLDGIKVMDVFDECLRKYTPQGSFFLSLFMSQYSLRMRDVKKGTDADNYIDDKDSFFGPDKNTVRFDIEINNNEKASKEVSTVDKYVANEYSRTQNAIAASEYIEASYAKAYAKMGKKDLPYLRYYFTVNALSIDFPVDLLTNDYLDRDFFTEQLEQKKIIIQEYERERIATGKNLQKIAFLKKKYTAAIAKKYNLKSDTIRKKFNEIHNILTEIGAQFNITQK